MSNPRMSPASPGAHRALRPCPCRLDRRPGRPAPDRGDLCVARHRYPSDTAASQRLAASPSPVDTPCPGTTTRPPASRRRRSGAADRHARRRPRRARGSHRGRRGSTGCASRTRSRTWGRSSSSVTTSTDRPSSASRSATRPPKSNSEPNSKRPASNATSRSTSLSWAAEPRAIEPNTRTSRAPRFRATSRISARRARKSSNVAPTAGCSIALTPPVSPTEPSESPRIERRRAPANVHGRGIHAGWPSRDANQPGPRNPG